MKSKDRKLLIRALEEDLGASERRQLERLLEASAQARRQLDALERLQETIESASMLELSSFSPGFSDRVMRRVAAARSRRATARGGFADQLAVAFYRIAAAGVVVAAGLGAFGLISKPETSQQTPVEAVLGLPSYSLESALTLEGAAVLPEPESESSR